MCAILAKIIRGRLRGDVPPSDSGKNCNFHMEFARFGAYFLNQILYKIIQFFRENAHAPFWRKLGELERWENL